MPYVPAMHSNLTSPSPDMSFEGTLLNRVVDDKAGASNESIDHLTRPVEANHLMRRPPLPPCILRRPPSRVHTVSSSSIRSLSPASISSNLSYRSKSLSISPRPRSALDSPANFAIPPRRVYPMANAGSTNTVEEASVKEQAPVVFDASLNFVFGCDKQRVRQSFKPTASHLEPATASSYLSSKISQFLKRTDHIMDEWRSLGHRDDADNDLDLQPNDKPRYVMGRSQSATNIMIRGFQYYSRSNSVARSSSCSRRSVSRASEDRTISDSIGPEVHEHRNIGLYLLDTEFTVPLHCPCTSRNSRNETDRDYSNRNTINFIINILLTSGNICNRPL